MVGRADDGWIANHSENDDFENLYAKRDES
jgi:hypothetical protein